SKIGVFEVPISAFSSESNSPLHYDARKVNTFPMENYVDEIELNVETFIDNVKLHPVVWNTKLASNKDKKAKTNAWSEIGEDFGISGDIS
uniref:MADF domain-containing protein n=1 Tax=Romanomermis culicivorax TaxID=13658 RepID=A0A915L4E9_ROMCU